MSDNKPAHWNGIILNDGTVLVGFKQIENKNSGLKRITGFIGERTSPTKKVNLSDTVVEEQISNRIYMERIPRTIDHIDRQIDFLKFLKKNKLCGETLNLRLAAAKGEEKTKKSKRIL